MGENGMPQVAPWLQGLEDAAWEEVQTTTKAAGDKQFHDNEGSVRSTLSRIPRRSLNGHRPSSAAPGASLQTSSFRHRSPLATLSSNDKNTQRRYSKATLSSERRSVSEASDGSVVRYSTVQQRAKSSSPAKQESLEWKKRLLRGKTTYGDQTELFGPSGLDNIFTNPQGSEQPPKSRKANISWLDRSEHAPMPSSPPPWPVTRQPAAPSPPIDARSTSARQRHMTPLPRPDATDSPSNHSPDVDSSGFDESVDSVAESSTNTKHIQRTTSRVERGSPNVVHDDLGINRTIGGQTELEQEDFSPVFVSKHTTMNGQVNYKALDSHLIKQFHDGTDEGPQRSRVECTRPQHSDGDQAVVGEDMSAFTDGPESEAANAAPDLSLSENLPTGTPPLLPLDKNVQVTRGGYLNSGSFQYRALSPSSQLSRHDQPGAHAAPNLLSPLSTSALLFSRTVSTARGPSTPSHEQLYAQPKLRSSGSPLKLFGAHDTFTNNRLLRRMSQLDPEDRKLGSCSSKAPSAGTSVSEIPVESQRQPSTASFGTGDLDEHSFDAEVSTIDASQSGLHDSDGSPGSEIAAPGSKVPSQFRLDVSPGTIATFRLKRTASKRNTYLRHESMSKTMLTVQAATSEVIAEASRPSTSETTDEEIQRPQAGAGSGKRPHTTPHKDSTPKRRRTLHISDIADERSMANASYHEQLQEAVSSRKRKDARKGDVMVPAEPDILAQRRILRPRNPTPSQIRKAQIEAEIRETAEDFVAQEPERLEAVIEQIESSMAADSPPSIQQQAHTLAGEVAKFSLRVQKASGDQTERKRSVTTQDFFDEAVMVMKLIRERAGRQSALGSVAESDQEALRRSQGSGDIDGDISSLRVSRPPSREGGSGWRPRGAQQADIRVLSHLRKFQERDDTDFIVDSIGLMDGHGQDTKPVLAVDEEANIQITGPVALRTSESDRQASSALSSHRSMKSEPQAPATHNSVNTSSSRTLHTTSTRKSENVGTLAPDAVAHLIGDHVGGMTFDKNKQQWTRNKASPKRPANGSFLEPLSNISSDDDPFREISDLPVDEDKEEEIRKASCSHNRQNVGAKADSERGEEVPRSAEEPNSNHSGLGDQTTARPSTSSSDASRVEHPTSDPSVGTATHYTALGSSLQQRVETRATSWGDDDLQNLGEDAASKSCPYAYPAIDTAWGQPPCMEQSNVVLQRQIPADVFPHLPEDTVVKYLGLGSSDEVEVDEPMMHESTIEEFDSSNHLREDTTYLPHIHSANEISLLESPKLRQTPWKASTQPASVCRAANRQVSLRRKTLASRLKPNALEQSEMSFVAMLPGERTMSVSLSLSRPLSNPKVAADIVQSLTPSNPEPSFLLSDLPDFTMHEADHERPSERALAQRLAHHAAAEVDDRFAHAVQELVKTLTDVQQHEPYWEDLKQLDLHGRSLSSLHGLDDFCASVQNIDLSSNALTHLSGAPSSIRQLTACANQLSSLTSWSHLINLQYLDVSGNQLDSLDAMSCLIHLRELRADNNRISSIEGLQKLDGLLKLSVRQNSIQSIDFGGSNLLRLEELDLSDNQISSVLRLDSLSSLRRLRIDRNNLQCRPSTVSAMSRLQSLSLQDCGLESLDVSHFPSLRSLCIDGNCLTNVEGIGQLQYLDLLSMRRQILPEHVALDVFSQPLTARTVRVSANSLPSLALAHDLLCVQHLELASCGLQQLPPDFGLRMPNLRTLNLNFNALKDLRPLLNIHALEQLFACGNLLARLRKTAAALAHLRNLKVLDLRDNPLTHAFYQPPLTAYHALAAVPSPVSSVVVRRALRCSDNQPSTEPAVAAPTAVTMAVGIDVMLAAKEREDAARYCFPLPADHEACAQHDARLDEGVALHRRVYLMLLADSCAALKEVDGATFDRAAAMVRDRTWERLVELGIVKKKVAEVVGQAATAKWEETCS